MEDILMKDMVFIAEHKESGTRVEFQIADLYGWDDETIFLQSANYAEKLPETNLWLVTGGDEKEFNDDYIFRLKRKDEKEEGLIRPREIVSAEALKDERMLVTYSNGEILEYDLEELIANERKYGRELDYRNFQLTRSLIVWHNGLVRDHLHLSGLEGRTNINPELETESLKLIPMRANRNYYNERFREEIVRAGEFEWYYGVRECQETLEKINLNQPLFYIIAIKEKYSSENIGYIGYTWKEDVLNLELYIYQDHRRKGCAKEAVRALLAEAFEGRLRIYTREEGRRMIRPRMVTATVRMDNDASRQLMESCGFQLEDGIEILIPQEGHEPEEPLCALSYTITAERILFPVVMEDIAEKLVPGMTVYLASRESDWLSQMGRKLTEYSLRHGQNILYFSLRQEKGKLNLSEQENNERLVIDDTCGLDIKKLRVIVAGELLERKLDMVVVDALPYIMNEDGEGKSRVEEWTDTAMQLKHLTAERNIILLVYIPLSPCRSGEESERKIFREYFGTDFDMENMADRVFLIEKGAPLWEIKKWNFEPKFIRGESKFVSFEEYERKREEWIKKLRGMVEKQEGKDKDRYEQSKKTRK